MSAFEQPQIPQLTESGHFIIKCSCGKVIAQCRCMGPKREETRPHPACEQGAGGLA